MPRRKLPAPSSLHRARARIAALPKHDQDHVATLARMMRRLVAEHSTLGRDALMLVAAEIVHSMKEHHHDPRR